MRGRARVASRPDSYLPSMPKIPATTPRTAPTRNPPPIMRLNAANGNVINAPTTPRFIIIIIPPVMTVNPAMTPIRVAMELPIPEAPPSHQKIRDQLVGGPQNPGESNAAAFTSIRTADAVARTKAQTALLPANGARGIEPKLMTPPATPAARLCPQYGQMTASSGTGLPQLGQLTR